MITDYCCTADEWSPDYRAYVEQRGYNLLSVVDYGKTISQAGFSNVQAIDKTDDFISILSDELVKFEQIKEDFIKVREVIREVNYIIIRSLLMTTIMPLWAVGATKSSDAKPAIKSGVSS